MATIGSFTKSVDKASPRLFGFLATAHSLDIRVELCTSVVSTRGDLMCSAAPTSIYVYSHAFLAKDQITSSAIFNDTLEENVTFAYQRVSIQVDGVTVVIG